MVLSGDPQKNLPHLRCTGEDPPATVDVEFETCISITDEGALLHNIDHVNVNM